MLRKTVTLIYCLALLMLTILTYTQIDARTISFYPSMISIYLKILHDFNVHSRSIIGTLFVLNLILLFLCYAFFIIKHKFHDKKLFLLTLIITSFSCIGAFSNDVLSYAMYTRIVWIYHQIPWFVSPNFFKNDPLTPLLHWPDSYSRYGPMWILLSSLSTYFVIENILLSWFAIKIMLIGCYVFNLFIIKKICIQLNINQHRTLVLIVYNPFFIIEGIISPHTDILMSTFALLTLYFLLLDKNKISLLMFIFSVLTKIVTFPTIIIYPIKRFFCLSKQAIVLLFLILTAIGSIIIIIRWSINPWYFFLPMYLLALNQNNKALRHLYFSLSFALIVRYLPYIFIGFFDPTNKIRLILFLIMMFPYCVWFLARRSKFSIRIPKL